MGLPKAMLPFGDEVMLQRVVRILSEVVDRVVVVAAKNQPLPPLGEAVEVICDRREDCGPLEGLGVGLAAIQSEADAAYVTSCDVPLLERRFVERLFELLGDFSVAVPREEKFYHPLAAVYRCSVLPQVEQLIAAGRMRPAFLFEQVATRKVIPHEWQDIDPESRTLNNLNCPDDYFQALQAVGFTAPPEIVAALANSMESSTESSTE